MKKPDGFWTFWILSGVVAVLLIGRAIYSEGYEKGHRAGYLNGMADEANTTSEFTASVAKHLTTQPTGAR